MAEQSSTETLESLVAQNRAPEAIQRLKTLLFSFQNRYHTELTLLESRAAGINWETIRGTSDFRDLSLEERKFNFAFLNLLNEIRSELESNLNFFNAIETSSKGAERKILEHTQSRIAGRYMLGKLLKEGNSVLNIMATDVYSNRQVVLKLLKANDLNTSGTNDQALVQEELQRVVNLKHRNIIKILDVYFDSYPYFLVTEYVWGVDLEDVLKTNISLPWLMVLDLLCELCDTLEYIHRYKIFHSCIRPSKIMLDEEGKPMISPFEVIKAGQSGRTLEKFQEDCQYLSQELLESDLKANNWEEAQKSDQFSLGLLAYELMVGKPLFDGKSIPEIMKQREAFLARPELRKYLPDNLLEAEFEPFWQIVAKLLQRNPADRFESLRIVYLELQALKPPRDYDHEIAIASYNRCLAARSRDGRDFIDVFYHNFFEQVPAARAQFKDRERQHKMFRNAVRMFLESGSHPTFIQKLTALPAHRGVDADQYRIFMDQFFLTIRQHDSLCTQGSKVEKVWLAIQQNLLNALDRMPEEKERKANGVRSGKG